MSSGTVASQRRRWIVLGGLGLLLLAFLGVMITVSVTFTPERLVDSYLDKIAAGDGAGANAMVNPEDFDPEQSTTQGISLETIDVDLVAARLADSGTRPITDQETSFVSMGDAASSIGGTATVSVDYEVDGVPSGADLRVKRLPNTWYGTRQWQIVDPLLIDVTIMSNLPTIQPWLGGAPTPASDWSTPEVEEIATTWVYPGDYTLDVPSGRYLRPEDPDNTRVLAVGGRSNTEVIAFLPTQELIDEATAGAQQFARDCASRAGRAAAECGLPYRFLEGEEISGAEVDPLPSDYSFVTYDDDPPLKASPRLSGLLRYTVDGQEISEPVWAYVWADVRSVDDVQLSYHGELS